MSADTREHAHGDGAVLACGAYLKNRACLVQAHDAPQWSAVHGDLGDPANCRALDASIEQLLSKATVPVHAIAHDLHPDFYSTHAAQQLAARLGVPAIAVQHHHAHIAAVMAEHAVEEPVIGLALDGVGYGTDGTAWGGELLWVSGSGPQWQRLGHLRALPLPGGDVAAREPWRMAAAALHVLGRHDEIVRRYRASVGEKPAGIVAAMLARQLNCPLSSGAGRWFDAAAGALGISVRQREEAEAAIALEGLAATWLDTHAMPADIEPCPWNEAGVLDLGSLIEQLFAIVDEEGTAGVPYAAALFHVRLARSLAAWASDALQRTGARALVLGGGCCANRVLTGELEAALREQGSHVQLLRPQDVPCGDAGLALGQAWVARHALAAASTASTASTTSAADRAYEERMSCV